MVADHPAAVEAALQDRGVVYSDRFRFDEVTGRPRLTWRRMAVLVWRFPRDESPVFAATGHVPWTRVEHLLDELRRTQLLTHGVKSPKPHPDRVKPQKKKKASDIEKRRRVSRQSAARRQRELEGMGGD